MNHYKPLTTKQIEKLTADQIQTMARFYRLTGRPVREVKALLFANQPEPMASQKLSTIQIAMLKRCAFGVAPHQDRHLEQRAKCRLLAKGLINYDLSLTPHGQARLDELVKLEEELAEICK